MILFSRDLPNRQGYLKRVPENKWRPGRRDVAPLSPHPQTVLEETELEDMPGPDHHLVSTDSSMSRRTESRAHSRHSSAGPDRGSDKVSSGESAEPLHKQSNGDSDSGNSLLSQHTEAPGTPLRSPHRPSPQYTRKRLQKRNPPKGSYVSDLEKGDPSSKINRSTKTSPCQKWTVRVGLVLVRSGAGLSIRISPAECCHPKSSLHRAWY